MFGMKSLKLIFLVLCFLVVNGCAGMVMETMEKVSAADAEKNKQTVLAMGQRTFDVSVKILMKACVIAFSNRNFSVANMDKEMGFIVAEGGNILSPEKEREMMTKRMERLNKESSFMTWTYKAGNYTTRVNMNMFKKGDAKTLAKMSFAVRVQPLNNPNSVGTYETIPQELLPIWYQEVWDEIEKSIFMQRETILN